MDLGFLTKGVFVKTLNLKIATTLVALSMAGLFSGCAKKDQAGSDLNIQLQFGSYSTAQHKKPIWHFLEVKKANAAVSSLKMCFKRLRFKAADVDTATPSTDSDNIDFQIGEVDISSGGAALGVVSIPEGSYRRIEFDLDSHCASGKSIQLVNANGTFSTNQTVTIKFSGNFTADSDGTLTLGVQSILNQLNSYNGADLKVSTESISGVLSN